jgi:hypothetical protein
MYLKTARALALVMLGALTMGACAEPEVPCQDMICVQEKAIRAQQRAAASDALLATGTALILAGQGR